MTDSFVIEPLSSRHDRTAFACGVEPLDRYLQTQANQDIRRRISSCFVAVPVGGKTIAGFYTRSASSIPLTEVPTELSGRLPRYPVLPAALVGRLAVDRNYVRRSLGCALLYDVIDRTMRAEPAIFALVIDAKDEIATNYYKRFGFQPFVSRPLSFFLPLATAAKLIAK